MDIAISKLEFVIVLEDFSLMTAPKDLLSLCNVHRTALEAGCAKMGIACATERHPTNFAQPSAPMVARQMEFAFMEHAYVHPISMVTIVRHLLRQLLHQLHDNRLHLIPKSHHKFIKTILLLRTVIWKSFPKHWPAC